MIRKVAAPAPSRCAIMAMILVIRVTPTTLWPTFFINAPIILSNIPTSVMIPKNNTEKINNAAVACTPLTPSAMKSPISCTEKVPVSTRTAEEAVATLMNARDGTVTFFSNSTITVMIVANPRSASIVSFIVFLSFRTPLQTLLFLLHLLFCSWYLSYFYLINTVYRGNLTSLRDSPYSLLRIKKIY